MPKPAGKMPTLPGTGGDSFYGNDQRAVMVSEANHLTSGGNSSAGLTNDRHPQRIAPSGFVRSFAAAQDDRQRRCRLRRGKQSGAATFTAMRCPIAL
jgi:hypothetical protein